MILLFIMRSINNDTLCIDSDLHLIRDQGELNYIYYKGYRHYLKYMCGLFKILSVIQCNTFCFY